ncbi:hypothetical protein [Streptomyces sp. NBC_01205]|nr:hypothetical protein OG573_19635 [Streptomyces sp. NBC_01205]
MFGKKSQSKPVDLTSSEAVAKSQKVYDRITSGKCKDAAAELDAAHKRKR